MVSGSRLLAAAALAASAALVASGCSSGGEATSVDPPESTAQTPAAAPPRCASVSQRTLTGRSTTVVATARRPLTARSAPKGRNIARFTPLNVNGVPTVFRVLAERVDPNCRATWYRVELPIRPNEAKGWIRASDVVLDEVSTRIEVDLSERQIRLFRGSELVLETPTAIGKPSTPTPLGRYYVNQRLPAPDPRGPFGPAAVGISAFSPTLVNWAQGGPIAIHGTNDPSSIGLPVSNGCLRIANDQIVRLFELAAEGTPVVIRA